jgi:DNA ligase D-like protein (predicted 3'-phosphoesterase)
MNFAKIGALFYLCIVICAEGYSMPKKKAELSFYRAKRDFSVSPEPTGNVLIKRSKKSKKPLFVIQKHNASHLHYDLRLQIGDVLTSWAIPKGPSLNPKIKRLAVETEDHPLDYAYFEGVIPEGYGAGVVMVWDLGTYESLKEESMKTSYDKGRIEFRLHGEKLHGDFVLIRTGYGKGENGKKNWLLIKMKDDFAHGRKNPVSTQNKSVLTGRTTLQIKKGA